MPPLPSPQKLWRYWGIVEEKIKKEVDWLREVVDTYSKEEKLAPMGCRECFMRRIAILIISGKIEAQEIKKSPLLESLWLNKKIKKNRLKIHHGSDWHRETMDKIENHFLSLRFRVIREPTLHQGRTDLGVYKKGAPDLFIEVGTTSFFKLWLNLLTRRNFVYLIVPNDEKLIEFTHTKAKLLTHDPFNF